MPSSPPIDNALTNAVMEFLMKPTKLCLRCKKSYTPTRSWQKYCSTKCQSIDYNEKNDIPGRLRQKREEIEILNKNMKYLQLKGKAKSP
jgi:endogenous inhibitor of DNA gyrase (YacG/DUF329 family)